MTFQVLKIVFCFFFSDNYETYERVDAVSCPRESGQSVLSRLHPRSRLAGGLVSHFYAFPSGQINQKIFEKVELGVSGIYYAI